MSKTPYPPPQSVPVHTNATTASPNVVKAITLDPGYELKTAQVVLTREQGTLKMSVYRESTSSSDALGMFSREDFVRTSAGLKFICKANTKFLRPDIPHGAHRKMIGNVELHTMDEMSEQDEQQLRTDLLEMLRP